MGKQKNVQKPIAWRITLKLGVGRANEERWFTESEANAAFYRGVKGAEVIEVFGPMETAEPAGQPNYHTGDEHHDDDSAV